MRKIDTSFGAYEFEVAPLYVGEKRINKVIAKRNLLILKRVLDDNDIRFGLLYGTLLGAVRENDFIDHDEDIDVFILSERLHQFLDLLFILREVGLIVARYDERGFLSLIRDGEYIDIYFFGPYRQGLRKCCALVLPEKFLTDLSQLSFLGEDFCVPRNYIEYLEFEYGNDWKIPKVYSHTKLGLMLNQLKYFINDIMPLPIRRFILKKIENKRINNTLPKLEKFGYILKPTSSNEG